LYRRQWHTVRYPIPASRTRINPPQGGVKRDRRSIIRRGIRRPSRFGSRRSDLSDLSDHLCDLFPSWGSTENRHQQHRRVCQIHQAVDDDAQENVQALLSPALSSFQSDPKRVRRRVTPPADSIERQPLDPAFRRPGAASPDVRAFAPLVLNDEDRAVLQADHRRVRALDVVHAHVRAPGLPLVEAVAELGPASGSASPFLTNSARSSPCRAKRMIPPSKASDIISASIRTTPPKSKRRSIEIGTSDSKYDPITILPDQSKFGLAENKNRDQGGTIDDAQNKSDSTWKERIVGGLGESGRSNEANKAARLTYNGRREIS